VPGTGCQFGGAEARFMSPLRVIVTRERISRNALSHDACGARFCR
jgi:hypothetical protein